MKIKLSLWREIDQELVLVPTALDQEMALVTEIRDIKIREKSCESHLYHLNIADYVVGTFDAMSLQLIVGESRP
ncbi:MAG: hypothetical protein ACE14P_13535 [Methanotrichaceae archaeon]